MRTKLNGLASIVTMSTAMVVCGCKSTATPAPVTQPPAQSAAAPNGVAPPAPAPSSGVAPGPASLGAPQAAAPSSAPPVAGTQGAYVAPAAPVAPRVLTAAAGSRVAVRINQTLKASTSNVGDGFSGELAEPLVARGGGVVFARGTRVDGTIVASKGRGRFKGAGALGIELTSIGGQRVSTSEYEKAEKGRGKRTGAFIGGGGGVGALIGGLAGGGKGALIGGLAGAGAGTAGAAYTGNHDVTIPSESLVTFTLRSSVSR